MKPIFRLKTMCLFLFFDYNNNIERLSNIKICCISDLSFDTILSRPFNLFNGKSCYSLDKIAISKSEIKLILFRSKVF